MLISANCTCFYTLSTVIIDVGDGYNAAGKAVPTLGTATSQMVEHWVEPYHLVLVYDPVHDYSGGNGHQHRLD